MDGANAAASVVVRCPRCLAVLHTPDEQRGYLCFDCAERDAIQWEANGCQTGREGPADDGAGRNFADADSTDPRDDGMLG